MNYDNDHDGYANESQAAFALSQSEFSDDSGEINRFRCMGRYVVVGCNTAYCPRTDAILGKQQTMLADFATYDEAEVKVNELRQKDYECDDYYIEIQFPITITQVDPRPIDESEIPF